jgi:DNA-binding Lrp family transcriptional regulator
LEKHPNYLFALINKAHEYYNKEEYSKMPRFLGETMELKDLYPEREKFHLEEVVSFYYATILYFSAMREMDAAHSRLDVLRKIAPDHNKTEHALYIIMAMNLEIFSERQAEAEKKRIKPEFSEYNKSVQTDQPPVFYHPEIYELYKDDFEIDQDILAKILKLPRESVISDLRKVLQDGICRYEYFDLQLEVDNIDYQELTFPVHAVFLLGELGAVEALEDILETFRQGEDFIEFWYGDFIREVIWLPLYKLAENNLEALQKFMLESGVHTYAKSAVSEAVLQYYLHHPDSREQISNWYNSLLTQYLNPEQPNLIDSDLIGFIVCDIIEGNFRELLPIIDKLFDAKYVGEEICGNREAVHEDIGMKDFSFWRKETLSIYELYDDIVHHWSSFIDEEEDDEPDPYDHPGLISGGMPKETPVKNEPGVGRNDPCPCGSGKKYKRCCWNKKQN